MLPTDEVLFRVHRALPKLREWINALVVEEGGRAKPVDALGHKGLSEYFEPALLRSARVTAVARIPFPPVTSMGVPEFEAMSTMPMSGITFNNVFFALESQLDESLCFHELIHVIQWQALGVDDFLLTYAAGLLQHGYERSPLEAIAYATQALFDTRSPMPGLTAAVIDHARTECGSARVLYARAGVDLGA